MLATWPPPPAGAVMCSYNAWRGAPSCASKALLTDLLRGQMGFQGFVVTDKFGECGLALSATMQRPNCIAMRTATVSLLLCTVWDFGHRQVW